MSANSKAWDIEQAWSLREKNLSSVFALRNEWRLNRYKEQDCRCIYCRQMMFYDGALTNSANALTLDHLVSLYKNGPDTYENTFAACYAFNQYKGISYLSEFVNNPIRLQRLATANNPPTRLSVDLKSPQYSKHDLDRDVRVLFKYRERFYVHEYFTEDGWVKLPIGKSTDRFGKHLLIKLTGSTQAFYRDLLDDLICDGQLDYQIRVT